MVFGTIDTVNRDEQLGALEIKDATTTNRLTINTAGAAKTYSVGGSPVSPSYWSNVETVGGTLGATNTFITFSQDVGEVFIQNMSTINDLHYNVGAVATTNNTKILPTGSRTMNLQVTTGGSIGLIASGANTRYSIEGYY